MKYKKECFLNGSQKEGNGKIDRINRSSKVNPKHKRKQTAMNKIMGKEKIRENGRILTKTKGREKTKNNRMQIMQKKSKTCRKGKKMIVDLMYYQ